MKYLLIILAIVVASCAPSAIEELQNSDKSEIEKQCRELEGKPVEDIYRLWGSPLQTSHSQGYKVLVYRDFMPYKNAVMQIRRDVFVKNGIVKICKVQFGYARR